MFAIVARSARLSAAVPSPMNSTNFPTTLRWRSISVIRKVRSVAVTPSLRVPVRFTAITSGVRK
ncbi:MAG: hypothetical protein BWY82_02140 [Verrucomicrobia bacterium ADurb.Bin474]|nr:MAG: hypothetical protein BWY82_02140 [Verrucomicrobia bacterium ADurb.Bin474]